MGMRTYGLSGSGMDIDQLVKDMMAAKRLQYDKLWKKKTQLEYKKADYNTMYNSLKDFREKTVWNHTLDSTLVAKTASTSNADIVTAKAGASAANVSHTLEVTHLAEGVTLTSSGPISKQDADKKNLASQFEGLTVESFKVKINGTEITVNTSESINEFVNKINNSDMGIKANYDTTLDRFFMYSTGTGEDVGIDFSGSDDNGIDFIANKLKIGSLSSPVKESTEHLTSFSISKEFSLIVNGKKIEINTKDTIDTFKEKLEGVNVQVSYIPGEDNKYKFSLSALDESKGLNFIGNTKETLEILKSDLKLDLDLYTGQDAQFTLDGASLSQSKNSFTIAGVTYDLKGVTETNKPVRISIAPDNDKSVQIVKDFIDKYNTILTNINGELKETKYSSYQPLTDDEKAELGDSQIKKWEDMSRSGMLRNDTLLQGLAYQMRRDISTPLTSITSKYNSLSAVGVTTGDYSEGGILHLDEDKLKAALEEDPDIVRKLLGDKATVEETSENKNQVYTQRGAAVRLYQTLNSTLTNIKSRAGATDSTDADTESTLAKQIKSYQKDLDSLDDRLKQVEDRYYRQFDQMESMLSKLYQQSNWLYSQFSG